MTTEEAGVGSTVSSACTSSCSAGHNGHAGIEALSRLRENVYFAALDAEKCKKLREQMAADQGCTCKQKS